MSVMPGPWPASPVPGPVGPQQAAQQLAVVEAAVSAFEGIDPADLAATCASGETLSETLMQALDDDSRHDASR